MKNLANRISIFEKKQSLRDNNSNKSIKDAGFLQTFSMLIHLLFAKIHLTCCLNKSKANFYIELDRKFKSDLNVETYLLNSYNTTELLFKVNKQ